MIHLDLHKAIRVPSYIPFKIDIGATNGKFGTSVSLLLHLIGWFGLGLHGINPIEYELLLSRRYGAKRWHLRKPFASVCIVL